MRYDSYKQHKAKSFTEVVENPSTCHCVSLFIHKFQTILYIWRKTESARVKIFVLIKHALLAEDISKDAVTAMQFTTDIHLMTNISLNGCDWVNIMDQHACSKYFW